MDKLRPHTKRIWQRLSLFEKRQFNRHLRTRWNIHRHRIAPEIHERLQRAIADGRLEIIKGRLRSAEEIPEKISLTVDTSQNKRIIDAGAVINCTGPREGFLPPENSLFAGLFASGAIIADELNMGVQVAPNLAVIDREGQPCRVIFAVGSILKGTLWESIAVPELRSQAFRVAENITIQRHIAEVVETVIEYSI